MSSSWGSGISPSQPKAANSSFRPFRTASTRCGSPWLHEVEERGSLAVLLPHEQERNEGGEQDDARGELLSDSKQTRRASRSPRIRFPTWSWFCAKTTNFPAGRWRDGFPCRRLRYAEYCPE